VKTLLRKTGRVQSYCTQSRLFRWHCGRIVRSASFVTRRNKIARYELRRFWKGVRYECPLIAFYFELTASEVRRAISVAVA
jgi:hypothetical protein